MYANFLKLSSFFANLFRKRRKENKWKKVLETLSTIEALTTYYYERRFKWVKDRNVDNFKQPEIFFECEEGDCDCFGKSTFEFMKRKGYQCWFVGIWKNLNEGHAIVIYFKDGSYNYVSIKKIVYGFESFDECVRAYYGNETRRIEIIDKSI